ncbi:CBS domain-containing protein [Bradyrhizobium sp. ARR65]|uniref:CBS domain-containing protein n=1 Tax=Bradyrhizobium sp. ARR65 TaxID=1040989 RepID=UPI000463B81C|nr:CBS domain-containing protein [Bradyrhizobium sp. ARR65]
MYVGDILRNKSPHAVAIGSNETVGIAAGLMRASNVGALVVRNASYAVVGIFCERDIVSAIAERGATGLAMKLRQFVSPRPLVSCSSQDTLAYVEHLMTRHQIRYVPVIDNGRLVGVVSLRDIAFAYDEAAAGAVQAA